MNDSKDPNEEMEFVQNFLGGTPNQTSNYSKIHPLTKTTDVSPSGVS